MVYGVRYNMMRLSLDRYEYVYLFECISLLQYEVHIRYYFLKTREREKYYNSSVGKPFTIFFTKRKL